MVVHALYVPLTHTVLVAPRASVQRTHSLLLRVTKSQTVCVRRGILAPTVAHVQYVPPTRTGGIVASVCSDAQARSEAGSAVYTDCICKLGWYGDAGGACTICPAGSWCEGGVKTACIGDSTNEAPGAGSIVSCECNPGYTRASTGACKKCVAGKYKKTVGEHVSSPCAVNTYSTALALELASDCVGCPANTASAAGSNAVSRCTCLAGYEGNDGTACDACPAGTFKTATGDSVCTLCVAHHYSTSVAATTSDGVCIPCQDDASSSAGSDSANDCVCDGGFFDQDGTCSTCEANYYCQNAARTPCPELSFSNQRSDSVADCRCTAGYYWDNDGCTACGVKKYSTSEGATSADTCVNCPANTFAPTGTSSVYGCTCNRG